MIFIRRLMFWFTFLAFMGVTSTALAQAGGQTDEGVVRNLLDTIVERDYHGFIGYGTPAFAELTEQQFKAVAAQVGPNLSQGYSLEYLGMLRQQGLDISVWKISFDNNSDDLLATLNVRNGKVGGFFLR